MAKSPIAKKRSPRPLGPRDVYIILKPGVDPQVVREAIDKITFNGRTVLKGIESGQPVPVVKMRMDVEPRNGSAAVDAGTVADGDALAA